MTGIEIYRLIDLRLAVIDISTAYCSFEMEVDVKIHQWSDTFYKSTSVWFDCTSWDEFTMSLNRMSSAFDSLATLQSMDKSFLLTVLSENGQLSLTINCLQERTTSKVNLSFQSEIDEDLLGHLKDKFIDFEKWW